MATEEHLELVRRGAEALNEWRAQHPEVTLDLSKASLRRANLARANLSGADFSGSDLEWADVRWADLIDASLSDAKLVRADFHKADFRRANLARADLSHANLEDANVAGANLYRCIMAHTRLINVDFSGATSLPAVLHKAASELDRETLAKNPDLPIEFLRGCGLYAAYRAVVYRVVVGSPSDVEKERKVARDAIYSWNDHQAHHHGAVLLPVLWETHAVPELGDRPQAIVNRQLIETSQILVCIFWTRVGTATGKAQSGTVEEIIKFMEAGKPVLVYFSGRPLPQTFDPNQWQQLQAFKERIKKHGVIDSFKSDQELVDKIIRHVTEIVRRLQCT